MTFDRERRLREAGLIEAHHPFGSGGALLIATRRGIAACGRPELRPQRFSPYTERHSIVVAHVAARLELAGQRLLSEREFAAAERLEGRRIYSAARHDRGYHRPDLVLLAPGHGPEAIEVELTNKASRRLDELLRCWRHARMRGSEIERVVYLCPPRTLRYVERALARERIDPEVVVAQPLRFPNIQLHRPTCDSSGGPGEAVKGRRPDPRRGLTDSPPPLPSRVGRGRGPVRS